MSFLAAKLLLKADAARRFCAMWSKRYLLAADRKSKRGISPSICFLGAATLTHNVTPLYECAPLKSGSALPGPMKRVSDTDCALSCQWGATSPCFTLRRLIHLRIVSLGCDPRQSPPILNGVPSRSSASLQLASLCFWLQLSCNDRSHPSEPHH